MFCVELDFILALVIFVPLCVMATAPRTVVKKSPRRRGTVPLSEVRKVVERVYAAYTAGKSAVKKGESKPEGRAAKKNKVVAASR